MRTAGWTYRLPRGPRTTPDNTPETTPGSAPDYARSPRSTHLPYLQYLHLSLYLRAQKLQADGEDPEDCRLEVPTTQTTGGFTRLYTKDSVELQKFTRRYAGDFVDLQNRIKP